MKNCICKGLCVIFILLSLLVMMIPSTFAAQDGHGGVTEVIARVEAPAVPQIPTEPQSVSPTEPLSRPVTPADSSPVQTGETVVWIALLLLLSAAVILLILRLRMGNRKD